MELTYKKEERLHAVSHGIGVILGLFGLVILMNTNSFKSNYATFSILVYGVSIILLFTASTLYHIAANVSVKKKLRILDHISIYFLIAGTYTPVALITLVNGNGWVIFYLVWSIAIIGTVLKLFYTGRFEALSLLMYIFMGWLIIFDISNLIASTSTLGLSLLALGGAFYTLGIFFYAMRRIPYNHLIWHIFVLGGAISHWLFIYFDVI